jgi:Pvc16 N-terminal domain
MIHDLSETLRAILTQPGLPPKLAGAQIVFDRPADPFNPTQTTIDLFLYELRENLEMRGSQTASASPSKSAATPPPLPLACTYLVTAWPVGGPELALQEQRLLSEALQVLTKYRTIPAQLLQGSLAGRVPLPQMLVLHPDALKNASEFWTSLGNKLRPSLSVTVTLEIPSFQGETTTASSSGGPAASRPH